MTYENMCSAIWYVLASQNFESRIEQYEFKQPMPDNEVSERWLVKHKVTGETFLIKTAPRTPADDPVRQLALNELKVLQNCSKSKTVVELEDFFEEGELTYTVHKYMSKSLRDYVTKGGRSSNPVPEQETIQYVQQLVKSLHKLHSRYIVHRDLRMDAVRLKIKKKRVYLYIGQFDFALQLKKNHTVLQTFNVTRPLAPEIQSGKNHDMAADIWALGQIAYQLLCCPCQE